MANKLFSMNDLHPDIAERYQRLERQRTMLLAISPHACQVERLMNDHLPGGYIYIGEATLYVTSFQATSHTAAVPLLRALRLNDWIIVEQRNTQDELVRMNITEKGFRWKLEREVRPGLTFALELDLDVQTSDEAQVDACVRIKVGETVREVVTPVYEVICPNGQEPIESEAAIAS